MKMKNISQHLFLLILISAGLAISSCNQNAEPPVEQEETDMPADRKVTLTQDQVELAGFKFGQPELKVLSGHVDAPGKLSLPSGAQAKISPVFGGIVHSIEVTLGQTVKKGQVLAYLTDPEYIKIQNEYLSAHINLNLLEDEYKRQQRLFDQQVSSEKKRIQAKTEFQTTKAEAKALELMISQIGLDPEQVIQGNLYTEIPVKSPITGIINDIMINLGENITEDDKMFEVSCRNELLLELDVFEKDILNIKNGQRVSFWLANAGGFTYEAKILTTGGAVIQNGGVVKVLASFYNENQQLIPGMFVAAKIHTGEKEFNALPESAIMNSGTSNTFVYYTTDSENSNTLSFEKVGVSTGYNEDGFVQVSFSERLDPAARVVISGGYYIMAEEGGE